MATEVREFKAREPTLEETLAWLRGEHELEVIGMVGADAAMTVFRIGPGTIIVMRETPEGPKGGEQGQEVG